MSVTAIITVLGWIGAFGAVTAYGMVTTGRWTSSSGAFQVTNLVAAALMFLVAAYNDVWPSAAANVVWVAIGAHALWSIARTRLGRRPAPAASAAAPALPSEVGALHAEPRSAVVVEDPSRVDLAA